MAHVCLTAKKVLLKGQFLNANFTLVRIQDEMPEPDPLMSWDVLGKRFAAAVCWCVLMLTLLVLLESGAMAACCSLPLIEAIRNCRCNYAKIVPRDVVPTQDVPDDRDPDVVQVGYV